MGTPLFDKLVMTGADDADEAVAAGVDGTFEDVAFAAAAADCRSRSFWCDCIRSHALPSAQIVFRIRHEINVMKATTHNRTAAAFSIETAV